MADETHSVTIAIPKVRVYAKSSEGLYKSIRLKSVLKRTMESRSMCTPSSSFQKYAVPNEKPLPVQSLKSEELFVYYRTYDKTQLRNKHRQKIGHNIFETYKCISDDLRKRLYVENQPNKIQALTDMDEDFYKSVNGRPLPDRVPTFKSLKAAMTELMRVKYDIGSTNEIILNMEVNNRNELKLYELSLRRCMEQGHYFDNFISEDYRKSMLFLKNWEQQKSKLHVKLVELQNLASEQFTIVSRLMGLDYLYGLQQKYGRFLYYLSPPIWRSKNREFAISVEIEAKGFDLGNSSEEDTFNVVFDKMLKECYGNSVKPVLYFNNPNELIDIFESIERQQLHHFAYITHLAPHKKSLKEGIKCLKDIITLESLVLVNTINNFKQLLDYSTERCTELETSFFNILNGIFYETVGSPDVLKLFLHLEFCYEKVYAEKAMNMDIVTLATALESFYVHYSFQLEAIHSDTVKLSITKCLEFEKRKMRRARLAARELLHFQRLEQGLLRAHEPIGNSFQYIIAKVQRSKSRKCVKYNYSKDYTKTSEHKPLNDSELEYLTLFTDWMEGDDPTHYLHRQDGEK